MEGLVQLPVGQYLQKNNIRNYENVEKMVQANESRASEYREITEVVKKFIKTCRYRLLNYNGHVITLLTYYDERHDG